MKHGLCLIASIGAMLVASPTVAAPIDDFLARLNAWLEPTGVSIDGTPLGGKSKSGETRMALTLNAPSGAIPLGTEVSFSPIETWDGDLLFAEKIVIAGFDHTSDGMQGEADTITLGYVTLPPPGTENPYLLAQMLGSLAFDNLKLTDDGDSLMIDHLDYAMGVEPEYGAAEPTSMAVAATLKGLLINERLYRTLNLSQIPVRYEDLIDQKLDLYLPLHWSLADGMVTVSEATASVESLGTYAAGFQIGGLTMPLLEELSTFGLASASGAAITPAEQQALGVKLLAGLTFNAGTVSLTDRGMVNAMLTTGAVATQKTVAEFKAYIADFLDDSLGNMQLADARIETLITGLSAFAEEGGTFGLDAFPETPASLIELFALTQTPDALLERIAFAPVHVPPEAVTTTATPTAATAPVAADFLDRLASYIAAAGGSLDYDFVDPVGTPGGLMSFTIIPPSGAPFVFPSGGYVDRVEVLPGDILKSSLSLDGLSRTEMGVTAGFGSLIVTDILLPPPGTSDPYLALQAPGSWALGDVSIDTGAGVITAAAVKVKLGAEPLASPNPETVTLSLHIDDFVLPESLAEVAGDSPLLLLAGHSYDLDVLADWKPATGALLIYEAKVSGDALGELKTVAFLGGFTPALFADIWALNTLPQDQQAAASQSLGMKLLAGINLNSVHISITDAGMVDDALAIVKLNTGLEPPEAKKLYANLFAGLANEAGASDLAAEIGAATQNFFETGGTLTISAGPLRPTSLLQLAALASTPKVLVEQMGIDVVHGP